MTARIVALVTMACTFGSNATARDSSHDLVLIEDHTGSAVGVLARTGAALVSRHTPYYLALVAHGGAEDLAGLDATVVERDAFRSDACYYWVQASTPGASLPAAVRVLFEDRTLRLVSALPADVERLPAADFRLALVTRTPKPFGRADTASSPRASAPRFDATIDAIVGAFDQARFTSNIQALEDFQTRYTHSPQVAAAANWIFASFQGHGLAVERHAFTIGGQTKHNIIATKRGLVRPDEVVFVTAHYDSTSNAPSSAAPGSDDDGTGTALVLEMARVLSSHDFERTIKFACFCAEEQGLVGSAAYVADIAGAAMDVKGCFNFDMIGYSGVDPAPPDLVIYTDPNSSDLVDELRGAALHYFPFDLEPVVIDDPSMIDHSDQGSFWQHGYPGIFAIEEVAWGPDFNPHYHTTTDLLAYLDMGYATRVAKAGAAAVAHFAEPLNPRILAGAGPATANPPTLRAFPPEQDANELLEVRAYAFPGLGVEVSAADLTGDGRAEILTGPGPGTSYGPHVRGFRNDGSALPGVSFMAYGTMGYGVRVADGDVEADGFDEIVTAPGPGTAFGPHLRAFDVDGAGRVVPVRGCSFMAFPSQSRGASPGADDVNGDTDGEILVGAGPGAGFGPHVRGFDVRAGAVLSMPNLSFFAYATAGYGVVVGSGDVDDDSTAEILTGPGPSPRFSPHVRGFDYDGVTTSLLPGFSILAGPAYAHYGARVDAGADLDVDGRADLVVGSGPDPAVGTAIVGFSYDGSRVTESFSLQAFPSGFTHGTAVATDWF